MERDRRSEGGNLFVLEGIIISLILLGAAYAVSSVQLTSTDNVRPRAELDRLVDDALTVLGALDDGNGTKLLGLFILEAMHCARDATPSTTDCDGARAKNLSVKLDNYLPLGGGWAMSLGNGAAVSEIWRSPLPMGEAVAASRSFGPEWNTTFVFTEFSCYPSATEANATLIPIDRARVSWARWSNVTIGTTEYEGKAAYNAKWWNLTLPATRPDTGTLRANTTGNGTFPGLTAYGLCGHDGLTTTLHDALKLVKLKPANPSVPVGSTVSFSADFSSILAVPGVSVTSAAIDVYEPLPTRSQGADTWLRAGDRVTLGTVAGENIGTWQAPSTALYGTHPALLRLTVNSGTNTFEMRWPATIEVALASGEVPIDPPYRAVITGWLADWG